MTVTATLYNYSAADAARPTKRRSALPAAVRRVVIVGGRLRRMDGGVDIGEVADRARR